jgi:hypothetical protein
LHGAVEQAASIAGRLRIVVCVTPTAAEVADQLYTRWNDEGVSVLTDSIDPEIELICDPLRPDESVLRGLEGWKQWVARWNERYDGMRIAIDVLIPMDDEHVLALVSIRATARSSRQERSWAAAHLWTIRDGRIARWEPHVDLTMAAGTLA